MMENVTKLNYCDFSSLQAFKQRDHELLVLHVNIRSLQKNFDDLYQLICQFKHSPDIICLSETRLKNQVPINVNIHGYNFVNANSPTNAGGVGMYVSSNINYSTTKSFEIDNDGYENIWIKIQNDAKLSLIIGAVYRHPNSNVNEFTKSLDVSLSKINQQHAKCVVLGDFNIDIMDNSPRPHVKNNYINMLNSNTFQVLIDKPTRITPDSQTLIDHVISNYTRPDSIAGILNYEITDHLPIFLALTSSPASKEPSNALYRSFKNFNENAYTNDLHSTLENWFLSIPNLNESNFNIVF